MRTEGFSLLELVIAVGVLSVGALAVAASVEPLGRLVRRGAAQVESAAAAGAEIESLRAAGCATPASGVTAAAHALRVDWTVAGAGAREVTLVVTYPWGPGVSSDTFHAAAPCAR